VISSNALARCLTEYLPRQRWYGAKDKTIDLVRITEMEVLHREWPALVRVEAEVSLGSESRDKSGSSPGGSSAVYQLLLGLRPEGTHMEFFAGHEHTQLGEFETEAGTATVYDAVIDPELCLILLGIVAPGQEARLVRAVGAEQSNTSLVYDEAMILKVFRRLADGPNPDVVVTEALARVGFTHVAEPLATWRSGEKDLGFLQRFLAGATEGWAMALTSLRDLYADGMDPAEAGGDFGAEAERLGEMTAELHLKLAEAFGSEPGDVASWADSMDAQIDRVLDDSVATQARTLINRLRGLGKSVPAARVHGDYHLGQVMRTDSGWFVLDFEGEPARPLAERTLPSSPMKDVSGMLRSFQYATAVAMQTAEDDVTGLARAWEARNREKFLKGYFRHVDEGGEGVTILPEDPTARAVLLAAFELDKAVYEVAYERAHRPDWESIPTQAVRRLVDGDGASLPTTTPGGRR
jgi:maltokinase